MQSEEDRKHRLTPREARKMRLEEIGVPASFVATIAELSKREDHLSYVLLDEDKAYFNLMTSDWADLEETEVTPLATGCNGDTFYLAISCGKSTEFVDFCLESGVTERFETFDDLVVSILYGIAYNVKSDEDLMSVAKELGFSGTISLSDMDL
ncbi:hypothetical protein CA13_10480 [Planctomycetes bacterium CA13]|uniref:Uncharacterized protein n=1 Tax=Novipirellula herctigrandis TaxID=2527986 RepID=A0A5C5YZ16_9BACT|nr:hypothetical protein CA13_10480 [Planctomycetes bacterium CA13]